ncbi:MAG TPA: MazG family protein [Propionibacteriaceae bacterium]|nr:MazG family protein [Propionibacteriaceae bacterium]
MVPDGGDELRRLVAVMHALRQGCPWDMQQTHASLLHYLVEEAAEVVDAVETGTDSDLCEELGDLLLQIAFHAEIASERQAFSIDDVARGISDKLIARHPHVFAGEDAPDDLNAVWEQRKRAEKNRTSALDGIPTSLPVLARTNKVLMRARSHEVPLDLPTEPIDADDLGAGLLALASRAQASGVDPEQALRAALRDLEASIRAEGL